MSSSVTRKTLRTVRVAGFTITEGVHFAGSSLPWHSHDVPTMCFVLRGSFTEMSAGESLACTPATLKLMPAGERHCDRFDRGNARGLLIEADPAQLTTLRPYTAVLDERLAFHGGLTAAIGRRLYGEFRAGDEAAPLAIEGLLLELLAAAARRNAAKAAAGDPPWLREARDRIHVSPAGRLSLSHLAEVVGVHPATLARSFRHRFGCSVGTYVRRLRIERAAERLGGTDLSLAEIALAAGFSDQSHFCNVFRQLTGMSPSAYRRALRAG